jgi:hypothetical protein
MELAVVIFVALAPRPSRASLPSWSAGTGDVTERTITAYQAYPVEFAGTLPGVAQVLVAWRAIQFGLSREAATRYSRVWVTGLTDIAHEFHDLLALGGHLAPLDLLRAGPPYEFRLNYSTGPVSGKWSLPRLTIVRDPALCRAGIARKGLTCCSTPSMLRWLSTCFRVRVFGWRVLLA